MQVYRNTEGQLHRLDGPALVDMQCGSHRQLWYENGIRRKAVIDTPPGNLTKPGTTTWLYDENGLLHNDEGPAITWSDGTQSFFVHGVFQKLVRPNA